MKKTENLNLTQFEPNDITNWLEQYNGDMKKIDDNAGIVKEENTARDAKMTEIKDKLDTEIEHGKHLDHDLDELKKNFNEYTESVPVERVEGLETRLGDVENTVAEYSNAISDLQTLTSEHSQQIAEHTHDIAENTEKLIELEEKTTLNENTLNRLDGEKADKSILAKQIGDLQAEDINIKNVIINQLEDKVDSNLSSITKIQTWSQDKNGTECPKFYKGYGVSRVIGNGGLPSQFDNITEFIGSTPMNGGSSMPLSMLLGTETLSPGKTILGLIGNTDIGNKTITQILSELNADQISSLIEKIGAPNIGTIGGIQGTISNAIGNGNLAASISTLLGSSNIGNYNVTDFINKFTESLGVSYTDIELRTTMVQGNNLSYSKVFHTAYFDVILGLITFSTTSDTRLVNAHIPAKGFVCLPEVYDYSPKKQTGFGLGIVSTKCSDPDYITTTPCPLVYKNNTFYTPVHSNVFSHGNKNKIFDVTNHELEPHPVYGSIQMIGIILHE